MRKLVEIDFLPESEDENLFLTPLIKEGFLNIIELDLDIIVNYLINLVFSFSFSSAIFNLVLRLFSDDI